MIIFTDNQGCIKDVGSTTNPSLIKVEINDEANPFNNWPTYKILTYRVQINNGYVTMMTPYKDSRLIEIVEKIGIGHEGNMNDITDAQEAIADTYDQVDGNVNDITDLQEAIAEIYEIIEGGNE